MKKNIVLIFLVLCVLFSFASAHPGRTDSNGGHHITATGEYHYHHGYPAHQHANGICPYETGMAGFALSPGAVSNTAPRTEETSIHSRLNMVQLREEESERSRYFSAWNVGYDAGKTAGRREGYKDGHEKGYADGYEDGVQNGTAEGIQSGYNAAAAEYDSQMRSLISGIAISAAAVLALAFLYISRAKNIRKLKNEIQSLRQSNQTYIQKLRLSDDSYNALLQEFTHADERLKRAQAQIKLQGSNQSHQIPPLLPTPRSRIKTFGKWSAKVHDSEKQFFKFVRANKEPIEILERSGDNAHIVGKTGCVYATSLNGCTCPDFNLNEHKESPCKHIYFLAIESGIPVHEIFEDYMKS